MRQIIISDTHSPENLSFILEYIKKLILRVKIDSIMINGDVLGINEIKPGYGFKFNKADFHATLNKTEILKKVAPLSAAKIIEIVNLYKEGSLVTEEHELELGKAICTYMNERYDSVIDFLTRFSEVKKTFFNLGVNESPIHYHVLKELPFLLDCSSDLIRKAVLLTDYRTVYNNFKEKLKKLEGPKFRYLGGRAILDKETILAGISGLNSSSIPTDSASELQEKLTRDMIDSIKRQFSYSNRLILYNPVEGRVTKEPFTFRPGSAAVRALIQEIKGKLRQKVFVQSHYHFMTTHFYKRDEFYFVLNNAGVNNCLFNMLDVGNSVRCFDVDPQINKIRELKLYDSYISDFSDPKGRLSLNYMNPDEIIVQRDIKGCSYM
ncbi:MAG: metallophosphoesterase [Nanoarchaeota archaeon]|nr:metallophosphoesterase [Nanoarchaeota archaeon]